MALDVSKDMDRLRSEVDEIRKDLKIISHAIRETGTEKGREAMARAGQLGQRARRQLASTEERIEHEIEERPFISLLAAVGIGFLIAKLLDSGR